MLAGTVERFYDVWAVASACRGIGGSSVYEQLMVYCDSERCIKCYACQVACKQWHDIGAGGASRRNLVEFTSGKFPNVTRTFLSVSCQHCADPACVKVCPAQAISKRAEDGIVVVDSQKCIGCRYCFFACPFGIPTYDDNGMNKCDMCLSLGIGEDGRPKPHCVATCPSRALYFGTESEIKETLREREAVRLKGRERALEIIKSFE